MRNVKVKLNDNSLIENDNSNKTNNNILLNNDSMLISYVLF